MRSIPGRAKPILTMAAHIGANAGHLNRLQPQRAAQVGTSPRFPSSHSQVFRANSRARAAAAPRAGEYHNDNSMKVSRTQVVRSLLVLSAATMATAFPTPSKAFTPPPAGYNLHEDKLDGYSFLYPDSWIPVTTSGNDCFYRNSFNSEENLFVDVTSPSSSKYPTVEALGTPEEAAEKLRKEYLDEFLSTRLGVKREAQVVNAVKREGNDGKVYYDLQIRMTSYASTNQLAVTQSEIDEAIVKEFDRYYLTTLGVANSRLYSLRTQTSVAKYDADKERLDRIGKSFICKEVQV